MYTICYKKSIRIIAYQKGTTIMSDYNNQNNQQPPIYNPPPYQPSDGMEPPEGYKQKSRYVAAMLAIFLGNFGAHNFYLGNTSAGIQKILLSFLVALITCGISTIVVYIWGIRDGIKLLDGRINVDAYGFYLRD